MSSFLLLALLCHVVSGGLLHSHTATVIHLYDTHAAPKEMDFASHAAQFIQIKQQPFSCLIEGAESRSKAAVRQKLLVHRSKAVWAPLSGYLFEPPDHQVKIAFNQKVTVGSTVFKVSSDSADFEEDPSPAGANPMTYLSEYSGGSDDAFVLETGDYADLKENGFSICRLGDYVNGMPGVVIMQTYSHNKTAAIVSTEKNAMESPVRFVKLDSLPGCTCDGVVDLSDWLSVARSPSSRWSSDRRLKIESSLFSAERNLSVHQLLRPLERLVLIGSIQGRHFELKYPSELRFVEARSRMKDKWPLAAIVRAGAQGLDHAESDKTSKPHAALDYLIDNRVAISTGLIGTSSSPTCAELSGFLKNEWEVVIGKRIIPGVGGPFNPAIPKNKQFSSSIGFMGKLVHDPNNPTGCDEKKGFPESLIPSDGERWVAVVDRGDCMFHEKGVILQNKGATAVVVVNTKKRAMIPALAGLTGLPVLDIPVVLIDDRSVYEDLAAAGSSTLLGSARPRQATSSPTEPLRWTFQVSCDPSWSEPEYAAPCNRGDPILFQRDGEQTATHGVISEVINYGFYRINGMPEIFPGFNVFKENAHTPCTAQLGTFIRNVMFSSDCELVVDIHSSLLCKDSRFRDPPKINKNITCAKEQSEKHNDTIVERELDNEEL